MSTSHFEILAKVSIGLCNILIFSNTEVLTKSQYYTLSPNTKTVIPKYHKHRLYII